MDKVSNWLVYIFEHLAAKTHDFYLRRPKSQPKEESDYYTSVHQEDTTQSEMKANVALHFLDV